MPIRDENGKELCGNDKRKRAAALEQDSIVEECERSWTPPASSGVKFSDLPAPPIGDPIGAMSWWNDILMVCADNVLRDRVMPLDKRVKMLADLAAKAGMIRDKAAESKAMREGLKSKQKAKEAAGLERVSGPPPPAVARPAG